MKTVSASDANRHFSEILREVSQGEVVTVVSCGQPTAVISPAETANNGREMARANLLKRLRGQKASGERNWTRGELYD